MNYIAHAVLSKEFDCFMLGQLLGDFAISSILRGADLDLQRGVKAHRELDRYTDAHQSFQLACKILEQGCSRYAPVVMDVLLDRVLVKNWKKLRLEGTFKHFLQELYRLIASQEEVLPERMRIPAQRMYQMDWFSGFAEEESFNLVFFYMSRRVRRPQFLLDAPKIIEKHWDELEALSLDLLNEEDLIKFGSVRFR